MSKLKEIIDTRDSSFQEKTLEIFELIHTTLVCVTEFLNDADPICAAGNLTWEDANIMEDLVVIIGMVEYVAGTEMEVDGNMVKITDENVEYFQRVVHMSLPFDLVEAGNEKDIIEFLHTMHGELNAADFSEIVEETTTESAEVDFDLTKLTEEQRRSLMMHGPKEKN
jgi:hypothetical protein